jgi:hypothetical protein
VNIPLDEKRPNGGIIHKRQHRKERKMDITQMSGNGEC